MRLYSLLIFAAALTCNPAAQAHDYHVGALHVLHPHARPTVPGQSNAAAYFIIENTGKSADRLIALASPVARKAEIHTTTMDGNISKMREVQNIVLAPASKTEMKPGGGYHIMLVGVQQPLKSGDKFPLTLTFEKSGKIDVSVWVEEN